MFDDYYDGMDLNFWFSWEKIILQKIVQLIASLKKTVIVDYAR